MFVVSNLILAIAQVLEYILWAYSWILLGRLVISFFNVDQGNPIVRFLYATTEPVLAPLRRRLPRYGGFDLSPLIAWLGILFLQRFLVRSLYDWASRMNCPRTLLDGRSSRRSNSLRHPGGFVDELCPSSAA